MITLLIDTSNQALSIAINKNKYTLGEININIKRNHSETLMEYMSQLFKMTNISKSDLSKIIVANGPGSYTGVRIGVTVAKTLASTLNIPLYKVSSLAVIAASFKGDGILVPMFDGRRGNAFSAVYMKENDAIKEVFEPAYVQIEDFLLKVNDDALFLINQEEKFEFNNVKVVHQTSEISKVEQFESLLELVNPHELTPEYLKLSEAEANWKRQLEK